ncbi:putative autophagy protein [Zalerion maritima]|uniref:Autophagy protein n=1 Tax=Zalerion maritima TaxID=339359 RepID=A0AAD5WSS2_9PEZI|nr:putative autophagy protein [Zalerion maritima]
MFCQKCRAPLKVDGSLDDLNPAAYNILLTTSGQQSKHPSSSSRPTGSLDAQRQAAYDNSTKSSGPALFKRHGSLRDSSAMSFVLLSDSQMSPRLPHGSSPQRKHSSSGSKNHDVAVEDSAGEPSQGMDRIKKLWEVLSARSDVDHPVCTDCTDILLDGMTKKLEVAARDRDAFTSALKSLQSDTPSEEELKQAEAEMNQSRSKQETARAELLRLEAEKTEVDAELAALELEARDLDETEDQFWKSRNVFATKLSSFQGERDSANSKFDHDSQLLEKLQRSNVYNDTFCISHDGTFATINGLRLGKSGGSRNVQVEWPEINAAWGHALLLLVTVAEKLNFAFDGLVPQPMGSTSRIIRLEQPSPSSSRLVSNRALQSFLPPPPAAPRRTVLELFFSSENLSLGRMFSRGRFGDAMVAFLELVRQMGAHVEEQTARTSTGRLCLPYPIKDDRIGEVSIRLGIGQDEAWTKACKLTLTCCKFLLAHASNVSSTSAARGIGVA